MIEKVVFSEGMLKNILKMSPHKIVVLVFHGVTKYKRYGESVNYEGRHIYVSDFSKLIDYFLHYFTPISLRQLHEYYYKAKTLPYNPLLLTFDDGFENIYRNAYPLLKERRCPAVIFVSTKYIDNKHIFWVEELEYAIAHTHKRELKITLGNETKKISLTSDFEKECAYRDLVRYFKNHYTLAHIEQTMPEIKESLAVNIEPSGMNEDYRFLSWEQAKELNGNGLEIEPHTHQHTNLKIEGLKKCREEIISSKELIERNLKKKCLAFAYPFGAGDDAPQIIEALKENELKLGFTTHHGVNKKDSNPLALKRISLQYGVDKKKVMWQILKAKP